MVSELIKRVGVDRLLEHFGMSRDEVAKRKWFSDITPDLLPHVLSFTYLSDTFSVMRVCKAWYNATRLKLFWYRRIENALKKVTTEKIPLDIFFTSDTLQRQMHWVFKPNEGLDVEKKSNDLVITRNRKYHVWVINSNGIYTKTYGDGDYTVKFSSSNSSVTIGRHNGYGEGKIENNSLIYTGQIKKCRNDTYQAHGDGKWVLKSDGRVIEGKGVAYEGELRLPLDWCAEVTFPHFYDTKNFFPPHRRRVVPVPT